MIPSFIFDSFSLSVSLSCLFYVSSLEITWSLLLAASLSWLMSSSWDLIRSSLDESVCERFWLSNSNLEISDFLFSSSSWRSANSLFLLWLYSFASLSSSLSFSSCLCNLLTCEVKLISFFPFSSLSWLISWFLSSSSFLFVSLSSLIDFSSSSMVLDLFESSLSLVPSMDFFDSSSSRMFVSSFRISAHFSSMVCSSVSSTSFFASSSCLSSSDLLESSLFFSSSSCWFASSSAFFASSSCLISSDLLEIIWSFFSPFNLIVSSNFLRDSSSCLIASDLFAISLSFSSSRDLLAA